jgi:hypothetical protein
MRGAQPVADEQRQQHEADQDRDEDLGSPEAPVRAGLREPVDHERETGRQQDQAQRVEALRRPRLVDRQDAQRRDEGDDADRNVDEEDPSPRHLIDEEAAEDRPQDRAEQHRHADDRHDAPDPRGAGGPRQDRHAGG